MWRDKGRSGIGDAFIGEDSSGLFSEGHTYEGWKNLSPNGRQWKNPLTDEVRDLSGANYWHLRKENFPVEKATVITAESYSTPSYYHKAKHKDTEYKNAGISVAKGVGSVEKDRAKQPIQSKDNHASEPRLSFWQEVLKGCKDDNLIKKWFYKG